jgi:short-subunit dehydrogenase involved in D-alanine esterification of teichoic acids
MHMGVDTILKVGGGGGVGIERAKVFHHIHQTADHTHLHAMRNQLELKLAKSCMGSSCILLAHDSLPVTFLCDGAEKS